MIIADNPPMDPCFYPDSGKAHVRVPGGERLIRYDSVDDLDSYDGEE